MRRERRRSKTLVFSCVKISIRNDQGARLETHAVRPGDATEIFRMHRCVVWFQSRQQAETMAATQNRQQHLQLEMVCSHKQEPQHGAYVLDSSALTEKDRPIHTAGCSLRILNVPILCNLKCFHASATLAKLQKAENEKEKDKDGSSAGNNNINERGGWKTMPYIIGNEACEKLATLGLLANMIVYLTTQFNMKNVVASNVLNIWSGTTNFSPLIGAFLSDSYVGRFWIIAGGSVASLIGMILLTLTAIVPKFRPPPCTDAASHAASKFRCVGASNGQFGLLLSSFAFLTIGAGGIRPCSIAFGADQFDYSSPKGKRSIQSFFNWYYFSFTIAMMVALTIIVYIQEDKSWSWGLGIPTALMLISVTCFLLGTKVYIHVPPEGSPFTSFVQVTVAAIKKRHFPLPLHPDDLYDPPQKGLLKSRLPLTEQFRFLNKAAIKRAEDFKADGSVVNPRRLCSLQQVEELKCIMRIAPIWSAGIVIFVAVAQQNTFSVLQALTMNRHLGKGLQIPAGSFGIFSMITLTLWLPIYDKIVVPIARRMTGQRGGITLLQRMGTGLAISIVSMAVAAMVETKRRNVALVHGLLDKPKAILPMSALWLVPQYSLAGLAEAFNAIGQIEFFYSQFPENMRSVAGALFFCSMAVANYLSSFVVTVVHKTTGHNGHRNWLAQNLNHAYLDYFYWLLAGLGALNLLYFIVCARWYRYKGTVQDETHNTSNQSLSHV